MWAKEGFNINLACVCVCGRVCGRVCVCVREIVRA